MGNDPCTVKSHKLNKLEIEEETLFAEKTRVETVYVIPSTPFWLLIPQVIKDCVEVPRTYNQYTKVFTAYEEIVDGTDEQGEVLRRVTRGVVKDLFGVDVGTMDFTLSKKWKTPVGLSHSKSLKGILSSLKGLEEEEWSLLAMGVNEEDWETFAKEWSKIVGTVKLLLNQMK